MAIIKGSWIINIDANKPNIVREFEYQFIYSNQINAINALIISVDFISEPKKAFVDVRMNIIRHNFYQKCLVHYNEFKNPYHLPLILALRQTREFLDSIDAAGSYVNMNDVWKVDKDKFICDIKDCIFKELSEFLPIVVRNHARKSLTDLHGFPGLLSDSDIDELIAEIRVSGVMKQ
jgi:hypothetical protein